MAQPPATGPVRPSFRTRTDVLFAAGGQLAVILRRGPRRHHQLLLWNLQGDEIHSGQWMKGLVHLHDLAPDGSKLIYWAAQYHASAGTDRHRRRQHRLYEPALQRDPTPVRRPRRRIPRYLRTTSGGRTMAHPPREVRGCWTAISTPPYFSALAIWPSFGHWTGGGVFRPDGSIVLFESADGMTPIENVALPRSLLIRPVTREDWQLGPALCSAYRPHVRESPLHMRVAADIRKCGATYVDWVSMHAGEDLLYAADGCLYRLSGWARVAAADYLRAAQRIADLTGHRFQLIAPSDAAMSW